MKRYLCTLGLLTLAGACFADEAKVPPLAEESGCTRCHAIDAKVVGPSWIEIAQRYGDKRNDPATIEALVQKVSKGGAGNWGDIPMVPNDPVGKRQDKMLELVKFVLSLSVPAPEVADAKKEVAEAKKQ